MNIKLETICIRITTRCNLKCSHCWSASSSENNFINDIDLNDLLEFVTILKSSFGLKHVSLSGGEPTLYPELKSLIEKLLQQNLYITITTSGTSPIKITRFVRLFKLPNSSKMNIRISIDGWRTLHDSIRGNGTYDAAIKEAERVSDELGGVGINTVVMTKPENADKIISDFSSVNIVNWALITPIERGRLKNYHAEKKNISKNIDLWKKVIRELKPTIDLLVWDYLSHPNGGILIEADGTIKLPGIWEKDDILIGQIKYVKSALLMKYIANRLKKDPVAYFSYDVKNLQI